MNSKRHFKRAILSTSIFLCFIILFSIFAGLEGIVCIEEVFASDTEFSDVHKDYWGIDYINKAAESGIINGYEVKSGGKTTRIFKPESPVTKEEAVAMIYRTMEKAGLLHLSPEEVEAYGEEHISDIEKARIAEWARPYVVYALAGGILEKEEIYSFVNTKRLGIPASRQEVAVWAAKAASYEFNFLSVLNYGDAEDISSEAAPYIYALWKAGIMQGDNNGNFLPASNIKRVEFAAICTRILDYSRPAYADIGDIMQIAAGRADSSKFAEGRIRLSRPAESGSGSHVVVVHISEGAVLIIDGAESNIAGLSALDGRNITVSAVDGFEAVVVQTEPKVERGTVIEHEYSGGYGRVLIRLAGGAEACYLYDSSSKIEADLDSVKEADFIADGLYILELI